MQPPPAPSTFDLDRFFIGRTRAWGMFQDRFGTVRRQFKVTIEGRREGPELLLAEDFVFDDGETEARLWRIRRAADGRYEGTAGDVVGVAHGEVHGRMLRWRYAFDLRVGERKWRVRFDDRMFQQDDEVVVGRARVSKFGFILGELSLFFHRPRQVVAVPGEERLLRIA